MPLNYIKNNTKYIIEYYSDINDLNYAGLNQNKVNINVNNTINYIGLVPSTHEQASDLSVRVNGSNLRLAKKSLAPPTGLSYNGGQTATPQVSSSVSYPRTLTTGTKITYSISPALSNGLSFDTNTGTISGTTTSNLSNTTHIITATNISGSTTFSFTIRIVYKAFTLSPGSYSTWSGYSADSNYGQSTYGSISNSDYKSTTIIAFYYAGNSGQNYTDLAFFQLNAYNRFINIRDNYTTDPFLQKVTINGSTYNVNSTTDRFVGQYNPNPSYFHLIYRWNGNLVGSNSTILFE